MEFLLGVFVGGLVVGGIVFAKVQANKAVARAEATPNRYLTGWQPSEADDTGQVNHRVPQPSWKVTPTRIERGEGL